MIPLTLLRAPLLACVLLLSLPAWAPPASAAPALLVDSFTLDPESSGLWTAYRYAGDPTNEVSWDSTLGQVYLTRAERDLGGAIFANQPLDQIPWVAKFRFQMGGGSGADGISMPFYAARGTALAGNLGFAGPGYAIEFDSFYNWEHDPTSVPHVALVQNSVTNHLTWAPAPFIADGLWHEADVTYRNGLVVVHLDGTPLITYQIDQPSYAYDGIGLAAGTGLLTNNHVVDDFVLMADPSIDLVPDVPDLRVQTNPDGTCTAYDDRDGNGALDSGEAIATVPCSTTDVPVNVPAYSVSQGVPGLVTPDVPDTSVTTPPVTAPATCTLSTCTSSTTIPGQSTPPLAQVCVPLVICIGPIEPQPVTPPLTVPALCEAASPICLPPTTLVPGSTLIVPGLWPIALTPAVTVAVTSAGFQGLIEPNVGELATIGPITTNVGPVPITLCPSTCPVPVPPEGSLVGSITVTVTVGAATYQQTVPVAV